MLSIIVLRRSESVKEIAVGAFLAQTIHSFLGEEFHTSCEAWQWECHGLGLLHCLRAVCGAAPSH